MRRSVIAAGLCASAILVCASGGTAAAPADDTLNQLKQQIETLKQQQGKTTANTGSLAIESWLLTSTAIDFTAGHIGTFVKAAIAGDGPRTQAARLERQAAQPKNVDEEKESEATDPARRKILVITAAEPLDFGQVAMLRAEMKALKERLATVCRCVPKGEVRSAGAAPAVIGAVASLFRSDTELTAIDQTVDAKLLAAAVAGNLDNAILPSAAIAATGGKLIDLFNALVDTADKAQLEYDRISGSQPGPEKDRALMLKRLLDRYDSFYARATMANANGIVPLAYAARLEPLMADDPYVLRVNTEKAGGTLVKRTNILTALGAPSAFITGGLVSSYQLTDPATGQLIKAGVITCRTTLANLKRVQDASWQAVESDGSRKKAEAICSP